jgi:Flp pilus assembly protein TadD
MLYEMTTGIQAHRHPQEPLPDLGTIHNGKLRSVIRRCLEQNPEKRYPSFQPIRERLIEIYRRKTGHGPRFISFAHQEAINIGSQTEYKLATALEVFGNEAAALQILERMALQFPEDKALRRHLAISYRRNARYDEAIRIWEQEVANSPEDPMAHLNYGTALASARNARAAVREYRKALALRPAYSIAWHNLANALRRRKRFKAALGVYHKVLELEPKNGWVYNNIGLTYEKMGCLRKAVEAYRSGLKISPGHAACAGNLAQLLSCQGEVHDAIRELTRAAEENPDSRVINKELGFLLRREGDKDAAQFYFESGRDGLDDFAPEFPDQRPAIRSRTSIRTEPQSGSLRDAFSLAAEGNIKEAIESFEEAETDKDIDAETYREFAMVMFEHGYTGRAFSSARSARDREPEIQLPEVLEILLREYPLMFDNEGRPKPEILHRFQQLREDHLAHKKE